MLCCVSEWIKLEFVCGIDYVKRIYNLDVQRAVVPLVLHFVCDWILVSSHCIIIVLKDDGRIGFLIDDCIDKHQGTIVIELIFDRLLGKDCFNSFIIDIEDETAITMTLNTFDSRLVTVC